MRFTFEKFLQFSLMLAIGCLVFAMAKPQGRLPEASDIIKTYAGLVPPVDPDEAGDDLSTGSGGQNILELDSCENNAAGVSASIHESLSEEASADNSPPPPVAIPMDMPPETCLCPEPLPEGLGEIDAASSGQESIMSYIDNITLSYVHDGGKANIDLGAGQHSRVCTKHYIRYRDVSQHSSLGHGGFLKYDRHLIFHPTERWVDLVDAQRVYRQRYIDTDGDGEYELSRTKSGRSVRLLNAIGNLVTTPQQAKTAEVTYLNGYKDVFEVINLGQVEIPAADLNEGLVAQIDDVQTGTSAIGTVMVPASNGTFKLQGITGSAGTAQRTISFWMNMTGDSSLTGGGADQKLISFGEATTLGNHLFEIGVRGGGYGGFYGDGAIYVKVGDGAQVTASSNVKVGDWMHISVVVPQGATQVSDIRIFVNGETQRFAESTDAIFETSDLGEITLHQSNFKDVRIYDREKRQFALRELTSSQPGLMFLPPDQYAGRLKEMKDRRGYGTTIVYNTHTQEEIDASPSRQWQIQSVTDMHGNQLLFTYRPTDFAGKWAVETIQLPNGQVQIYSYSSSGFLESVRYPDNTYATFQRGFDYGTSLTTLQFNDISAEPKHRRKTAYLSSNSHVNLGREYVVPQPMNRVRMVTNGLGELTYMNIPLPEARSRYVYEGGGKLKKIEDGTNVQYAKSYQFVRRNGTITGVTNFVGERAHSMTYSSSEMRQRRNPSTVTDKYGSTYSYEYNSDGKVSRKIYSDGTTETYDYNQFTQITRYEDRLNRVTKYTFDIWGNMTRKETGILNTGSDSSPNDVNQPEYASESWTYYTSGHQAMLLESFTDANGNVTNFDYDTNLRLIEIQETADTLGGPRPVHTYTYDSAGRLKTVSDPVGRITTRDYDLNQRLIKRSYNDGSFNRYFFAAGAGANAGLLIKSVDRTGNVTEFTYDNHDRVALVKSGHKTMDALGVETAVSDINSHIVSTAKYYSETNLVAESVTNGQRTAYDYDLLDRVLEVKVDTPSGQTLKTSYSYLDNKLFSVEDPYGRKSYLSYRSSDQRPVRSATYATGQTQLSSYAQVNALTRGTGTNPAFALTDFTLDAAGQMLRIQDPRGVTHKRTYDSRGRVKQLVAGYSKFTDPATEVVTTDPKLALKTEYDYDGNSNVTEIRLPRYFDNADTDGYQKAKQLFTYNNRNRLLSRTLPEGVTGTGSVATDQYAYHLDGKIASYTDFNGNLSEYLWHLCCGRFQAFKDAAGAVTITNNDYEGRITHWAMVNTLDSASFDRDSYDFHNPVDNRTAMERTRKFDHLGRVVADVVWLKPLGLVDANNPPVSAAEANALYGTAPDGQPYTDEDTLITSYAYDLNLTDGVGLDVANAQGGYQEQLSQLPAGFFSATSPGTMVKATGPEGQTYAVAMDGLGRTVIEVDSAGEVSRLAYDQLVDSSTLPAGVAPDAGQILKTSFTDARGDSGHIYSDGLGRTLAVQDSDLNFSSYFYDASGYLSRDRDALDHGRDYVRDLLGRTTSMTDTHLVPGEAWSNQFAYDAHSQLISFTDAKGAAATKRYDARDRLLEAVDRINAKTSFAYDAANNQLSSTDDQGGVTNYTYDNRHFNTSIAYPGHNASSQVGDSDYDIKYYQYDALGRALINTDQSGHSAQMVFDMASRVTDRHYRTDSASLLVDLPTGGVTGGGAIVDSDRYTYDKASRTLTAYTSRYDNQVSFSYDNAGRLATETLSINHNSGNPYSYTFTAGYDVLSRLNEIIYPDGSKVNATFTNRGQIADISYEGLAPGSNPGGTLAATRTIASHTYDTVNRMATLAYPVSGITHTASYTRGDNLISSWDVSHSSTGAMHDLSIGFAYDKNRNLASRTFGPNGGGANPMAQYSMNFTHDAEDRLTGFTRTGIALPAHQIAGKSWTLSTVHDWLSVQVDKQDANQITQSATQTRTHDEVHQITELVPDVGQTPLVNSHDAKGNLTGHPSAGQSLAGVATSSVPTNQKYDFDIDNLLKTVMDADNSDQVVATYGYDALGRRVSKTLGTVEVPASPVLVAQWDFENPASGTATDSGPNNLNGTLKNNAVQAAASAESLDGGYLDVTTSTAYAEGPKTAPWTDTTPNRTWSLWINAKDVAQSGRQFIFEEGGGTRGVSCYIENGSLHFGGWNRVSSESDWDGSFGSVPLANYSIDNNEWHHLAITLDGTEEVLPDRMKLYINGEFATSISASQLWSRNPAVFGNVNGGARHATGSQGNGSAQFNGWIDAIELYNTTFNASQILELISKKSLVASWDFETPGTGSATDNSGNNLNGTLQNGAHKNAPDAQSREGDLAGGGYLDLSTSGGGGNVKAPASNLWEGQTTPQRTVSLWFKPEDVTGSTKQFLYEEGGGSRGISIYIESGQLYIGGWNRPSSESNWSGDFISTPISGAGWQHVALVLDGTATVQPDALKGYLNGQLFGSTQGSQMWSRAVACVGRVDNNTRSHSGQISSSSQFNGLIDQVRVYDTALDSAHFAIESQQDTTIYACFGMQVLAEYSSNQGFGLDSAFNLPKQKYIYGGYVDQPLAMANYVASDGSPIDPISGGGEKLYFYHSDDRASVIGLTDEAGAIVELYNYTPYGQTSILAADGVSPRLASIVDNPYLFTGRRLDSETGLYYFRARYYDPALGRFVSRDPLGYVDGMSVYSGYFGMYGEVDPTGMFGIGFASGEHNPYNYTNGKAAHDAKWGRNKKGKGVTAAQAGQVAAEFTPVTGELIGIRDNWKMAWDPYAHPLERIGGGFGVAGETISLGLTVVSFGWWSAAKNAGKNCAKQGIEGVVEVTTKQFIEGAVESTGKNLGESAAKNAGKIPSGSSSIPCFVAGTLVKTESGEKPIETLEEGDKVWSYNLETETWELAEVEAVHSHEFNDELVTIEAGEDVIQSTWNHPFWVVKALDMEELKLRPFTDHPGLEREKIEGEPGRWVDARYLRLGDVFLTKSGKSATVTGLSRRIETVVVYNLKVEGLRNYCVGSAGVLVHNSPMRNNLPIEDELLKRIGVGPSGHHVPAVRKSKGRPDLEVKRSDKGRPTLHPKGNDPGHDHWRMHDAERNTVGPRQGDFDGTDTELFDAYREAYKDLDDIRVDVKSPNGTHTLGENVLPRDAVDLMEKFLKGKNGPKKCD